MKRILAMTTTVVALGATGVTAALADVNAGSQTATIGQGSVASAPAYNFGDGAVVNMNSATATSGNEASVTQTADQSNTGSSSGLNLADQLAGILQGSGAFAPAFNAGGGAVANLNSADATSGNVAAVGEDIGQDNTGVVDGTNVGNQAAGVGQMSNALAPAINLGGSAVVNLNSASAWSLNQAQIALFMHHSNLAP